MKKTSLTLSILLLFAGVVFAKETCDDNTFAKQNQTYCAKKLELTKLELKELIELTDKDLCQVGIFSKQFSSYCSEKQKGLEKLIKSGIGKKGQLELLRFMRPKELELSESLKNFELRAKIAVPLSEEEQACEHSIFARTFPNYCTEFPSQQNKDGSLLVGRVNMLELREIVKIWKDSYVSNKAIAMRLDGKEAYICHGYNMLFAAKRCALMGCAKGRDVPCAIFLENNNEVDIDEEIKAYRNKNR